MLKIYTLDQARQTILRRSPAQMSAYPPAVIAATENKFGLGVTPPQAVAMILSSIAAEGDAALRRWSETLDGVTLDEFQVPSDELAVAYDSLPQSLKLAFSTAKSKALAVTV